MNTETLKGLKEAYNRLIGWANSERIWARRTADGCECARRMNRAKNYEAIAALIDAAIKEQS